MIPLNNKIIKSLFKENYSNTLSQVNDIKNNILALHHFSDFLEITNITKTNSGINRDDTDFLIFVKCYETLFHSNNYSFLKCPLCKGHNFKYHKLYFRNISFVIGEYSIEANIQIIVIECLDCKNSHEHVQHYHAILPDAIYPYHIFSSSIILNAINDHFNKIKMQLIIEKYQISRQLLSEWMKIISKYSLSSSTILKIPVNTKNIVSQIINKKDDFQYQFFENYFHPFFLIRPTCIRLAITP